MATYRFLIQSKNNPANIYIRLSLNKSTSFKRKTGYVINPVDWSKDTGFPKQNDEQLKSLRSNLKSLESNLEHKLNEATKGGNEIDGNWLKEQIDIILEKKKKSDEDSLVNYFQSYIDSLPFRVYRNSKRGVSSATLKKYKTIKNKIIAFEKYMGKTYFVRDVDMKFRQALIDYFLKIEKLSANSTGRYITFIKTVCLDAKANGFETSPNLDLVKGFEEETDFTTLSFEELDKIEKKNFKRSALENAKDWLLIGCYIGQRVSDLLMLTNENIQTMGGFKMIVLTRKKTGKEVAIPIHDKIKSILKKRNWSFPTPLSAVHFNLHIKDICKETGFTQPIKGSKLICIDKKAKPKVWRKEFGLFPKHELITSHICRRTFATNFYASTPTALLINITAHSTEKQFLQYIGKPAKDFSVQLAEYWQKEALMDKKEPKMNVIRQAN